MKRITINNEVDKDNLIDVYIKDIIYTSIDKININPDNEYESVATGITTNFQIVTDDGVCFTLSIPFRCEDIDIDILFKDCFRNTHMLILGDDKSYTANDVFMKTDDEDYPLSIIATNSVDHNRVANFHFTDNQAILVEYINTRFILNYPALGIHNIAISSIPNNIESTDVLYVDKQEHIIDTYYQYDKKNKLSTYFFIFNLDTVKNVIFLCTLNIYGDKKDKSMKNKFKSFEEFTSHYENEFKDYEFYFIGTDNITFISFKDEESDSITEKVMLIYRRDEKTARAFYFYRYGYDQLLNNIVDIVTNK